MLKDLGARLAFYINAESGLKNGALSAFIRGNLQLN